MSDVDASRAEDELLRYVERFALALRDMGVPPMAARVFAYTLAEDRDRYTATDLAEALQVSPAAISGAVRQLVASGLLVRERAPGTRADLYVLNDADPWVHIVERQLGRLDSFVELFQDGAHVVGEDTPGGRRLAGSAAFFRHLADALPRLLDDWRPRPP